MSSEHWDPLGIGEGTEACQQLYGEGMQGVVIMMKVKSVQRLNLLFDHWYEPEPEYHQGQQIDAAEQARQDRVLGMKAATVKAKTLQVALFTNSLKSTESYEVTIETLG